MVKLLSLRSRKEKARAKEKKLISNSIDSKTLSTNQRDGTDASIETYSSSTSGSQTSNLYMNSVNQSIMVMYAHAQMSTTIAANMPKEEFGSQDNSSLYSPNATFSSRIIHPVECKRDIFVESVKPRNMQSKNHRGKSRKTRSTGKQSIYHAKVGREQSPYNESSDVHYVPVSLRRGSTFGSETSMADSCNVNGNGNVNNNNNNNRVNTNLPLRSGSSTFGSEESLADSKSYDGNNINLPQRRGPTYGSKDAIADSTCTNRHQTATYDEAEHEIDHSENYFEVEHRTDDHDHDPQDNAADELSLTYTYSTDEGKENEDKPANMKNSTTDIAARNRLSIHTSSSALLKPNLSIKTSSSALLGPNSSDGIGPGIQAAKARRAMGNAKFRPNNTYHLRVDTGPIGYEANGRLRMGVVDRALKLHTHDEHHESLFREHPRAAMDVSPSSTVSSLTLPAELEYYTPRDVGHSNLLPMITEDDGIYSEI